MKLTIQAPGKLMVSGEWSILEPGTQCLVAAVDRYVYCDYEDSDSYIVNLPDLGLNELQAQYQDSSFAFTTQLDSEQIQKAELARCVIEICLRFLDAEGKVIKPFMISTDTVEHNITIADGSQQKLGLGTSAAVAVSLTGTLLKIAGYDIVKTHSQMLIFKLSLLAHYLSQGKLGSGFDIAACAYGKIVQYSRFDEAWLNEKLAAKLTGEHLKQLILDDWPGLKIERLPIPQQLQLCAAWVAQSASTVELIKQMQEYKKIDPQTYDKFIDMIARTTDKLIEAFGENHQSYIINLIEANRLALQKLGEFAKVNIETSELAKLADIAKKYNAAGKLSGAGGGDCGIAICFDQFVKEDIEWAWEEAGFYPLDVFISEKGVSVWY